MKVLENFVHEGTIYKIGMDFLGNPSDELLPFLENSSQEIQVGKVSKDLNNSSEEIANNSEQLSINSEEINNSDEQQNPGNSSLHVGRQGNQGKSTRKKRNK
ncbi:MAG: hypothetical protein IPH62_15275 [Ignavibacteriae bacterium]|nr:hypothetical protein [Ignavibacteriota bacterium]